MYPFINYNGTGTSFLIVDSLYANVFNWRVHAGYSLHEVGSLRKLCTCGSRSSRKIRRSLKTGCEVLVLLPKASHTSIAQNYIGYLPYQTSRILMPPLFAVVLVCIQYTVRKTHDFNRDTFWQDSASKVRMAVPFHSITVWVVSPNCTDIQNTHIDYNQAPGCHGPLPVIPISFQKVDVTCTSLEMVHTMAPQLPFLDETLYNE